MSTPSISQSRVSLPKLAYSGIPLTISDIIDSVIPRLLEIPESVSNYINSSEMLLNRLNKFKMNLEHIKDHFERVKVLEWHVGKDFRTLLQHVVDTPIVYQVFTDDSKYRQLEEILKSLKPKDDPKNLACDPPGQNPLCESPAASRQLTQSYELLDSLLKECLLCFSAFPEGAEINKRTVIYWWIGEGLIDLPNGEDGEQNGHEILKILVEHGFIEDVITKGRVTSRCRLCPFTRSVLIHLAKAASFFCNLDDGEYNNENLSYGNKCRVLVKATKPNSSLIHLRRSRTTDLDCIETLFNVNKCFLDIKLHWFWKMKSMKALYLGRCDSKAIQHIEVKSCKFLAGLTYMKGLRFLSLQGVSKIVKLPNSVGSLKTLRILDLRDCNDMEELPDAVKSLEKLTHLDLSGCYSLARLPKGISSLFELQVLKGFIFREKHPDRNMLCSFQDLRRLKKLRKLSITTSLQNFPENEHLEALNAMRELRKLTIVWRTRRGFYREEDAHPPDHGNYLKGLEKLDLQHTPCKALAWMALDNLQNLKKLYIKGGKFLENLVNYRGWNVETLRLLHLPKLSMTWTELESHFPKLNYLEQCGCPRLTSIPCNDEGVWQKSS